MVIIDLLNQVEEIVSNHFKFLKVHSNQYVIIDLLNLVEGWIQTI